MKIKFSIFIILSAIVSFRPALAQQKADLTVESKVEALLKQLTLEEKIGMIHANSSFTTAGVPRLGIPPLVTSDGPHGVRPEHGRDWILDNKGNDSATYLPTGITLASTWNPDLAYAFGTVLGSEAKWRGKDVILGPGVNIIRSPLNGRNFEYMSEDPYLTSRMAVAYIKGVQDQGISACVKHFAANNQETARDSINVEMDERTLREIYLPAFEAAVREARVNTVMGAYNKFRRQYCTYNDYLINKILKSEWAFDGIVISDWGAIHHTKEALLGGADLEMGTDLSMLPFPKYNTFFLADPALKAVKSGEVPGSVIDDKVRRILRVMFRTNMIGSRRTPGAFATSEHAEVARKVAREGIILLKNKGNILPVDRLQVKKIAMIGANANSRHAMGGGSSQVRPLYEITPLEGIRDIAGNNISVAFSQGYNIARGAKAEPALMEEAVRNAKTADLAIVVGGWIHSYDDSKWNNNAYDTEGADKKDLKLPFGQDDLISAVIKANPNTVVVLYGGGAMDMRKWVGKAKAVILVGYPGQEGGNALAEIIFGAVNPSGKLSYSIPKKLEDSPAHKFGEYPGDGVTVRYREGLFVGYRYHDSYKVKPQFAFGYGLSYTSFAYGKPAISRYKDSVTLKFTLTNKGRKGGFEVVQLYVKDKKASVRRPQKELKAFQKVFLQSGESREIEFKLAKNAFSFFDDRQMKWVQEPGQFQLLLGSSSRDIKRKAKVKF